MNYYRPATAEDFKKDTERFEERVPLEVRRSIEQDQIIIAIEKLLQLGWDNSRANEYCYTYQMFFRAKQDFENGKVVYTDY